MAFLRSEDKIRQLVEILCGISELWSSSYYSELIMQSKSESVSHSVVLWVTLGDPRFLNSMEKSMEFSSKNTGAGCHSHLQGIFLIQGLKLSLLHCRQFLYHLSHKGSPWSCKVSFNPLHTLFFYFCLLHNFPCLWNIPLSLFTPPSDLPSSHSSLSFQNRCYLSQIVCSTLSKSSLK